MLFAIKFVNEAAPVSTEHPSICLPSCGSDCFGVLWGSTDDEALVRKEDLPLFLGSDQLEYIAE